MEWTRVAEGDEQAEGAWRARRHLSRHGRLATGTALAAALTLLATSAVAAWRRPALPTQAATLESKVEVSEGPIFGGEAAKAAFRGFLAAWHELYRENDGAVPELADESLPEAFRGVRAKVVQSAGGAAEGGVVTEAIGYGIMVEGVQAAAGNRTSLVNGLALMRSWLGMVGGPEHSFKPLKSNFPSKTLQPLGGGGGVVEGSATKVDVPPYGVSAILPHGPTARGPSGVAAWKYPINSCSWGLCLGSATDGDEDAVFGMIYLAAALHYPEDFTDTVVRALISVASADLGFPDLYRTLPDGRKVFVPKGGSRWGGLAPSSGRFQSTFNAGCINPSYFAPASYRLFRDFASRHWKPSFDAYLPPHQDGTKSSLDELMEAFDGAVIASYNLLYRSTCPSGSISNWAGSQAACENAEDLNCLGVPWAFTPHVGATGTCTGSGTKWGSWGKDACRAPWRIAMDYTLYPLESAKVTMYDSAGHVDPSIGFNAKVYLNRLASQYKRHSRCDGGKPGDCRSSGRPGRTDAQKLAPAFVMALGAPGITCNNVPVPADPSWWAAEMSHPTFAGFVAPLASLSAAESASWLDTFAELCDFSRMGSFDDMDTEHGLADLCSKTYFQASQQVVSAMVTSGMLRKLPFVSDQ